MKKTIIILSIFLINNLALADRLDFKDGSEPDGFREIKWGTKFSMVEKDMKLVADDPDDNELKTYTKKDDELHIGRTQLKTIEYYFWKGKFYSVKILTENLENWLTLKEVILEKFGTGFSFIDSTGELYSWEEDITIMGLSYDTKSQKGRLVLYSTKIDNEILMIKEQKILKGADNR